MKNLINPIISTLPLAISIATGQPLENDGCLLEMRNVSGIYILSWPDESEYFYIGQSKNMYLRYMQHVRGLKKGNHYNTALQNLFNKYKVLPEHEFWEMCPIDKLNEVEQKYLNIWHGDRSCINIAPTADGTRGWKRSPESCLKISLGKSGKGLSEEHKQNIKKGLRLAIAQGRFVMPKKFGKDNHYFGKHHSEVALSKMRGKSKGVGAKNVTARLTLNTETGIYYDYAGEAAATTNIIPGYLNRMLNGNRKNWSSFIYV